MATDSHTFINGLTSVNQPASIERLQASLIFLWLELTSPKWNGFWLITIAGIILARTKAFRQGSWVIPTIIGLYIISILAVYTINTFFPIIWWLSTTLNRILFALIPALIFWVFIGVDQKGRD